MIYQTAPYSAILNDPSRSHHYLMLNIAETVRDTDIVSNDLRYS